MGLNRFPQLTQKIKDLKAGRDVTVCSFKEADAVLFGAFPDAQKVAGAGPKAPEKVSQNKKSFKLNPDVAKRVAIYHKDYLTVPGSNVLYGHEELPEGHPHKNTPC